MSDLPEKIKKMLEGVTDEALNAHGPLELLEAQGHISEAEISELFSVTDIVTRVDGQAITPLREEKIGKKIEIGQRRISGAIVEIFRVAKAQGTLEGYTLVSDEALKKIDDLQTENLALKADVELITGSRDGWKNTAEEFQQTAIDAAAARDSISAELDDCREAKDSISTEFLALQALSKQAEKVINEQNDMIKAGREQNGSLIESRQELRAQITAIGEQNEREVSALNKCVTNRQDEIERLHAEVRRQTQLASHFEGLADKRLIRRIGRVLWLGVQKIDDKHNPS